MKKIAFCVHSPAPYLNIIFEEINKSQELTAFYEYYYDPNKGWKDLNRFPGKYYKDMGLFRLLVELNKYDYVLLGGWRTKWNIIIAFFLFVNGRKFAFFSDYPEIKKRSIINQLFKKCLLSICNNLFVACESVRLYYIKEYNVTPSKIKLLHYCYSDIKNIEDLRYYNQQRNIKLQHGSQINLFIATRFLERKGYQIVYEAFKMLKERNVLDNFHIVIAGSGPLYQKYEALFNSLCADIQMLGWIENDTYEDEMNKCDVYLHPSLHEPFGIPPLDAMIRGKLLLVSDGVQSTITIIKDRENGLLYKAASADQLFDAFSFLVNNRKDIYKIAQKGVEIVRENYSISHSVCDLNSVLNHL